MDIKREILQDKTESTLERYGYDLVFGVTLAAIKTQLGKHIDKVARKLPHISLYIIKAADNTLSFASLDITKQLECLDLFSIPSGEANRSKEQQAAWDKACNELQFAFGYDATPGFLTPRDKSRTLDFDTQQVVTDTKVIYHPFFKRFIILENQTDEMGNNRLSRYEQDTKKAWEFGVQVSLGINQVSLDSLPDDMRQRINDIDSGKLFSISQLFLNTDAFTLINTPDILSHGSRQLNASLPLFLKHFFERSNQVGGNFSVAYSLNPKQPSAKKDYIVELIDSRYYISPYLNKHGVPDLTNKDLYTLNYVGLSSPGSFPPLKPLQWNWVDVGQKATTQGALAIRRSKVMEFAANQFAEMISPLLLTSSIRTSMSGRTATITFDFQHTTSIIPRFKKDYSISYKSDAPHAHDKGVNADIDVDANYSLNTKISIPLNSSKKALISFSTEIAADFNINSYTGIPYFTEQHGSGRLYHEQIICTLELNIGNSGKELGKLLVTPTVTRENLNPQYDISRLTRTNGLNRSIAGSQKQISDNINQQINNFEKLFIERFNGQSFAWFIPGGESAAYSDTSFSVDGDLVFNMSLTD